MLELTNKRKSALDSDTKTQSKTQKLNNNIGVLDEAISRISSLEKLNGDTITLYLISSGKKWASKKEMVSLASSYFYTSLERPGDN